MNKKYIGNKFLAFGAAGQITIRECVAVYYLSGEYIYLDLRGGTKGNYYFARWKIGEVIPMNRKARRFLAELIWESQKKEFKYWRGQERRGTFPSFKSIKEIIGKLS